MNVQYAIKDGKVYVLEVNPRASRTVPYVSKATGVPLPKTRGAADAGQEAARSHVRSSAGRLPVPLSFFVKSPVFPFNKFPGVDPALGPEMRSTGEVMGVGENFGEAFAKAQLSAGTPLPDKGTVFISVNDPYKPKCSIARRFAELGFDLVATRGTAALIAERGAEVQDVVFKVNEGRPNAVDLLKAGAIQADRLHDHRRASRSKTRNRSGAPRSVSRALHHDDERRARGRGSGGLAAARSHPRLEPAGDS
jgi:carbamoyl-phosphate synthase large subunit